MAKFLRQQGLPVYATLETDFNPAGVPELAAIRAYAESVGLPPVSGGRGGTTITSKPTQWEENVSDEMKRLRHDFLHVSFRASDAGMNVRLANVAPWPLVRYRPVRHIAHG